jgi:hypothetical protein
MPEDPSGDASTKEAEEPVAEAPQDEKLGQSAEEAAPDAPAEAGSEKAAAAPKPKKRRKAKPKPLSEREINAPDFRSLIMLAVVFTVTVASWGAARFACNVQVPVHRPPPPQSTDALARTPKDAAIELGQRWRVLDFDGALQLATGNLAEVLRREKTECEKKGPACAAQREELKRVIHTTAVVLRQDDQSADARVTSHDQRNGKQVYRLTLVHDGQVWKGLARTPE